MISANRVIRILYCESTTKKGNTDIRLAKLAPAPNATKIAGRAQQISVEEEANKDKNKDKEFAGLSLILSLTSRSPLPAGQSHFAHWPESFS